MTWSVKFPNTATNRGFTIADGSQTGLDPAGSFTAEFWWFYDTSGTHTDTMVLAKEDSTYGFSYMVYWTDATPGTLAIQVTSADGSTVHERTWSVTISTGNWYHFAITFDAGAAGDGTQFELFQGDESTTPSSQGNGSLGTGSLLSDILNADGSFLLGKGISAASKNSLANDDNLFDVRFWDDIRTLTEIQNNFNLRLTGSETNLQGNWLTGTAEEEVGFINTGSTSKTLADATANANDLTLDVLTTGSEIPYFEYSFPSNYTDSGETWLDADQIIGLDTIYGGVPVAPALDADEIVPTYTGSFTVWADEAVAPAFDADVVVLGGTGSGIGQLYRMRANDGTLARQVYWTATEIDTLGTQYGGPGPLTDVVVSEILGD